MRRDMVIAVALLLPCAALAQQPAKPDKRQPGPETARVRAARQAQSEALRKRVEEDVRAHRERVARASLSLTPLAPLPNIRVDLDLNNVPVRDALKRVFEQAKQEFVVDADVPQDARITARADDVQLGTALDLITQSAGVRWGREIQDGKTVYRVGKSVPSSLFVRSGTSGRFSVDLDGLRNSGPLVYRFGENEQRSTFTCPHCKGQATVLRQNQQPRCPECQRVFQGDWQFCPHDGAKRPAVSGTWKFCPICGKAVSTGNVKQSGHGPDDITAVHLHR